MKKEKIAALLPLINSKQTGARGTWVLGPCPFAPWRHDSGKDANPSFGIKSEDTKKSIFKCFSCGERGDLFTLQLKLNEYLHKGKLPEYKMGLSLELIGSELDDIEFDTNLPDYSEMKVKTDHVFPEKWLTSFKPAKDFEEARDYLTSRSVPALLWGALDLRYDPFQKRICFPYRNQKGELMGMQGRYAKDPVPASALRYYFYKSQGHLNMDHWLGENHLDLDKPVVLVEGPFDYASVYRVYHNVAASFSAGLSHDKMKMLSDAAEIVTFYDSGKGGDSARGLIKKFFKGTPVVDVIPQNEGGDPGSMADPAEVASHLTNYVKLLYKG